LPSISNAAGQSRNRHKPYTKNLIALKTDIQTGRTGFEDTGFGGSYLNPNLLVNCNVNMRVKIYDETLAVGRCEIDLFSVSQWFDDINRRRYYIFIPAG